MIRVSSSQAAANGRSLYERQKHFAAALLNPDMPMPGGLVGPDREPSVRRFNVYRNNVVTSLVDTLKATFPAVRRIVGDEFFAAMARVYVASEPPRTPVMLDYGATFADFVDSFEPARSVPYLADVARLERAWMDAYHAAESRPVDLARLGAIDSRRLSQIALTLHPSVRIVRSAFPVIAIWLMNVSENAPVAIDLFRGGEHAIVMRPVADVEVRRVTVGAATFIQGLADGATIAEATALALDDDSTFDLTNALANLFATDAIAGWSERDDCDSTTMARPA
ncbi:DNA-binding domain-containing protein [Paraburkholderia caballeronis]|uniref:HvfC/BufC N-terminal domain-containing protein n=1 Tax=Paraburkholderia caballeronis TaxID=416943 RepID=UPI0010647453|nr:DNA-binding domain-containing protein [Paraburkholderia caballeronis]TDV06773.1 hypothetical protein C7408_12232 [Paraburkholderia caballeronis]TDV09953.1 hypothetical protein C7406_12432 [Paraburkholderia caballeronis]TDV21785.1 hypothetical protein C7404_12032 [Paraburkholderia caballeronis]